MDNDLQNITELCRIVNNNKKEDYTKLHNIMNTLSGPILSFLQYICLYVIQSKVGNYDISEKLLKIFYSNFVKDFHGTVTLTYGEVAESHVGMQKIGKMSTTGFSYEDLLSTQQKFKKLGCKTILIHLNNFLPDTKNITDTEERKQLETAKTDKTYQAYVLVIRDGLEKLLDIKNAKTHLLSEMLFYKWDSKLYNERRNIVQNKNARHNLNFDKIGQISNFEEGKGTTIAFKDVPILSLTKNRLTDMFGEKAKILKCEGNKYYDSKNTGIGYHGDTERRRVIGVRLGKSMNMHWMWYYNDKPRGVNVNIQLQPGDIYCMSEKTVGTDWRPNISMGWKKKMYTLRHAAGAEKYTTRTAKVLIDNIKEYNKDINIGEINFWNKKKDDKKKKIFEPVPK